MSYPFICADTEDDSKEIMQSGGDPFKKRVTQIAAITAEGKRYYNKGDIKAFLRWITQQPEPFIYFHNVQYDLGNLFGKELDKLDCTLVGGRMIKAVWGKKTFLDSFNMWPMSVKAIGKAFHLEKIETHSMANDKEYVFRDVEIILKAMTFAWNIALLAGLKRLPNTFGTLGVKLWQAWGGSNCHDSLELSREALYGGRVELFKPHDETGKVAYTDINSLYPYVMQKDYPGPLEDCETNLAEHGIAHVTMSQPETDLPVLPLRGKDGRILYPWGKFSGVWTLPELREAEKRGARIIKVHQCYGTNEVSKPYKFFTDRLYKARLASESTAEKTFFKFIMNSLYGRLGTTGVIGRTVYQTDRNCNDGVPFGEKVLVSYSMPLSEETNWCHAAYVSGYGRLELLKYLTLIPGKDRIYCDTDSTIFDCASGKIPFPIGPELGKMKLEGWQPGAEVFAPKLYHAGDTWKAKGVPQRLARQFIEQKLVHFDLPFKYREAVAFFDRKNSKRLSVWRTVEKRMITGYNRKKLVNGHFYPCKVNAV